MFFLENQVKAIDASCAMSFVAALFEATANPSNGASKVIKKFGKTAFKHWFKPASGNDLISVKIYETVRKQLSFNFGRHFTAMMSGLVQNGKFSAFVAYEDNALIPNIV